MPIQESPNKSTDKPINTRAAQTTRRALTKEKIISALQDAARELGHAPTTTEFARVSGIP